MAISGVNMPLSPVTVAAFHYSEEHTPTAIHNHAIRSAYWALILARKHPAFNQTEPSIPKIDLELVILVCILHDMGMAHSPDLITKDKRFEVDGANIARDFLHDYISFQETSSSDDATISQGWDAHRIEVVWNAIALHATISIAAYASPEIALASMAIGADFTGPFTAPHGVITEEEYLDVEHSFPLAGLGVGTVKEVMGGFCRDKPSTTFDNFASGFGLNYGYDGHGEGIEEYHESWQQNQQVHGVLSTLESLERFMKNQTTVERP